MVLVGPNYYLFRAYKNGIVNLAGDFSATYFWDLFIKEMDEAFII